MHPYFHIFSYDLPAYGLMAALGGGLGFGLILLRRRRFPLSQMDTVNIFALCLVGALVGAKLLYVITQIPNVVRHWDTVVAHPMEAAALVFGGLVFYGGVIGALGMVLLYVRKFHVDFNAVGDLFAPAILAAHALGRVGCFLGGCCYGAEASWGFVYTHSLMPEADGVPRIPVQLIEAGLNLLICLFLLCYERRPHRAGRGLALYALLYAPVRFTLEFFRGDDVRGHVWMLSTSQWLSLGLFALGLLLYLKAPDSFFTKREKGSIMTNVVGRKAR